MKKPELIGDWKSRVPKMWSVQVAVLMAILNGAVLGLAAFVDVINPWWFLGLNVAGYAIVALARALLQGDCEI